MNISSTLLKAPAGVQKVAFGTISFVQRNSPVILTTVGVVGVVTAGVLASKATLRLEPIIDEAKEGVETAKKLKSEKTAEEYSSVDYQKDITHVYFKTGLKVAKLYGPSVTIGLASIGCIVGAHGILHKRNVASAAAYSVLQKSFEEYKNRVVEKYGEEAEEEIRLQTTTETRKNPVTGEEETVKVSHIDPNGVSAYARFFDETNKNWEKVPSENLFFLKAQQTYANHLLRARGHVFLNEVYEALGMEHSEEGAVVGWFLDGEGDDYIDFGIYDFQRPEARDFVNGREDSILLDFNVDGLIYNKIGKRVFTPKI